MILKMLSRLRQALPLAAGPVVLGAHLGAEALVSGRSLLSVSLEPEHLYLLVLAVAGAPLWLIAARSRCLRLALIMTVIGTLALEGNGLGGLPLLVALLMGGALAWLGGLAIERAAAATVPHSVYHRRDDREPAAGPAVPVHGPYYAFVPIRGNRPPPYLL